MSHHDRDSFTRATHALTAALRTQGLSDKQARAVAAQHADRVRFDGAGAPYGVQADESTPYARFPDDADALTGLARDLAREAPRPRDVLAEQREALRREDELGVQRNPLHPNYPGAR